MPEMRAVSGAMAKGKHREHEAAPDVGRGDLSDGRCASSFATVEEATPSEQEQAGALRFAEVLAAIEGGRGALDELAVAGDDDEMAHLVAAAQLVRAEGVSARRSPGQHEATWARLRGMVPGKQSRRRVGDGWWPLLKWVALPAAAAAVIMLFWFGGDEGRRLPVLEPEWSASAVARVDASAGRYAQALLTMAVAPVGDTPLRSLREAQFSAWRVDTTLSQRRGGGGVVR